MMAGNVVRQKFASLNKKLEEKTLEAEREEEKLKDLNEMVLNVEDEVGVYAI